MEAKRRLYQRLKARPELANVQVTWGRPLRDVDLEGIVIGRVTDGDASNIATAPAAVVGRDESYTINVEIEVAKAGGTQEEADARAGELGLVVEDACRAPDSTLGDLLLNIGLDSFTLDDAVGAEARSAILRLGLACTARA